MTTTSISTMSPERPSIRDLVKTIQHEMLAKADTLTPDRASALLTMVSSLMGNCREEVTRREVAYNQIELEAYRTEQAANRARMLAKNSPQYVAFREAQDTLKTIEGLTASLKYAVRLSEAEMKAHLR